MTNPIERVAVIGTGVIGASWTALFLAKGLDVTATDVAPGAEGRLRRYVDDAWPALEALGLAPGASRSRLKFIEDLPKAVSGADLVQETVRSGSISRRVSTASSMRCCRRPPSSHRVPRV